jgi:hypothetical protein
MIRGWAKGAAATMALILFASVTLFLHQLYVGHKTRVFLREFHAVELDKSSYRDVKPLEKKFNGIELQYSPDYGFYKSDCSEGRCSVQFRFSNSWLATLRLAPATGLTAVFGVSDQKITSKEIWYESQGGPDPFLVAIHEGPSIFTRQAACIFSFQPSPEYGPLRRLSLYLGPDPSDYQKKTAYGFGLSCLERVRGCQSANGIPPPVTTQDFPFCSH